jgi:RNA recognition motif-containing protein
MRIFVGNLAFSVTNDELDAAFAAHGAVESATVLSDRETGRSRGFGFVEMPANGEAEDAIRTLNGTELNGRAITVNEARPREARW